MAKGSGGVGKGKTSVGGGAAKAAAKTLASAPIGEFAAAVNAMAKGMGPLTAISELHEAHSKRLGMGLDAFKSKLLAAYKDGKVELSRDERQLNPSPPAVLKASLLNYGGREFTHVRVSTW